MGVFCMNYYAAYHSMFKALSLNSSMAYKKYFPNTHPTNWTADPFSKNPKKVQCVL